MPERTWFFVWLVVMALSRLIRSYSATSLKPSRPSKPSAKRREVIVRGCIYIPEGLWAALERVDRYGEPWASLPPGERDADLEGLLEWIANAKPGEVLEIVSEIRRHYYNTGDNEGGDALRRALRKSLKATSMAEREAILFHYEPYTRQSRLPSFWIEEA
ncbi:MAG: hypothetical protein JWO51_3009 [Rhodospirillales bacterium]|nr:hypothetical protein [Rhodospirillales bacterium]